MNGKTQHLFSVLTAALLGALLLSTTAQAQVDELASYSGQQDTLASARPDDRAGELGPGGIAVATPDVVERYVQQKQRQTPAWELALGERSAALNARYGLGGSNEPIAVRPDDRGEIRGPAQTPAATVSVASSSPESTWVEPGYVTVIAFMLALLTSTLLLLSRRRGRLAH